MWIDSNMQATGESEMIARFLSEVTAYMGVLPSVPFIEHKNEGRWIRPQMDVDNIFHFNPNSLLLSFRSQQLPV